MGACGRLDNLVGQARSFGRAFFLAEGALQRSELRGDRQRRVGQVVSSAPLLSAGYVQLFVKHFLLNAISFVFSDPSQGLCIGICLESSF